jgi:prevent-host-death family protein
VKTIPTKRLQSDLDAVLRWAQKERILISRDGKPCAVLVGVEDYDAEDLRLATSPDFWLMIQQRRSQGSSIPLAEVESRLAVQIAKSRATQLSRKKKPNGK